MALFTGVIVNKIDRKGRVSVPAPFRATLAGQSFHGIAVYPATDGSSALEGSGIELLEQLSQRFGNANPFSPAYRQARLAIFSNVEQLGFDGEGRVMLTPKLIEHAGITSHAAFAGLGDTFQIWHPDALEAARTAAAANAAEEFAALELPPPSGSGT